MRFVLSSRNLSSPALTVRGALGDGFRCAAAQRYHGSDACIFDQRMFVKSSNVLLACSQDIDCYFPGAKLPNSSASVL